MYTIVFFLSIVAAWVAAAFAFTFADFFVFVKTYVAIIFIINCFDFAILLNFAEI